MFDNKLIDDDETDDPFTFEPSQVECICNNINININNNNNSVVLTNQSMVGVVALIGT
jgi:hypothetical protein